MEREPLRLLLPATKSMREALPERVVTATLQCAGNRRAGLIAIRDIPGEAPWGPGAAGPIEIRGDAFAGGERHVARVDVSLDGGASWSQAELLGDVGRWAWRHWRLTVELPPGEHEILVRAWDSSAPEDEAALWNPKG